MLTRTLAAYLFDTDTQIIQVEGVIGHVRVVGVLLRVQPAVDVDALDVHHQDPVRVGGVRCNIVNASSHRLTRNHQITHPQRYHLERATRDGPRGAGQLAIVARAIKTCCGPHSRPQYRAACKRRQHLFTQDRDTSDRVDAVRRAELDARGAAVDQSLNVLHNIGRAASVGELVQDLV